MEPYLTIGRILSILYFINVLILFPLSAFLDKAVYGAHILSDKKK